MDTGGNGRPSSDIRFPFSVIRNPTSVIWNLESFLRQYVNRGTHLMESLSIKEIHLVIEALDRLRLGMNARLREGKLGDVEAASLGDDAQICDGLIELFRREKKRKLRRKK